MQHLDAVTSVDGSSASSQQFSAVALSAGMHSCIPSVGQPVAVLPARPSEQSAPDRVLVSAAVNAYLAACADPIALVFSSGGLDRRCEMKFPRFLLLNATSLAKHLP